MATTHGRHEGRGIVLYDGCPRCDEHAADPFSGLDSYNLLNLHDLDTHDDAASNNDLIANRNIKITMNRAARIARLVLERNV